MAQVAFHSPTHALIARQISFLKPKKLMIVDYGCGDGELLRYLERSRLKQYRGYELNPASVDKAKSRWHKVKNAEFFRINRRMLPNLGAESSVDAIVLIGVVQYFPEKDFKHVLLEAHRTLKPGGKLIISCTDDHRIYSWMNLYRLLIPHRTVNRRKLIRRMEKMGLRVEQEFERGLFLAPLFSNVIVLFFDALDKVIYRTKGELGPIGRTARKIFAPLIQREFQLPIDFGYTLFVVASK